MRKSNYSVSAHNNLISSLVTFSVSSIFVHTQAIGLKGSAVELVDAMLEKTSPHTLDFAKDIAGSLDLGAVHSTLEEFYELKDAPRLKRLQVEDDAERGLFRAYHILVTLQDYGNDLGNWSEPFYMYLHALLYVHRVYSVHSETNSHLHVSLVIMNTFLSESNCTRLHTYRGPNRGEGHQSK